ncbi:HTH-type transcriptional activator IlvY [Veronia nyctiphanis]|uniref:HTH-type transcriptional activator IlvY n=1 Tax=Veronia nyctiphanis TaxID=1278244 RepID=A0A4Q0YPZ8_9GAMM|nr:HTH-type transcriptional activator IlvY [Veronia nyctiphanis]RXJ73072.1 HTH-type transcriptional activator IlvY [Veronia nyctiphanis]
MHIKNLQYFLHLCDSQSFSKTATSMHISPSALSRIIQRLEEDVGQQLLIRTNRHVSLTAAGKQLAPVAMQIVTEWQTAVSAIREEDPSLKGKLTVFCSVTASYSHLPDLLNRFRQNYPQIEIQLQTGDPAQSISHIMDDTADIAISAKPGQLPADLYFKVWDKVSMSVIAPSIGSNVPGFSRAGVEWDTVPLILPESGRARENANNWLKGHTRKPNIYAQIAGHEGIVSMVALGCGIGIAPDVVIDNSPVKDKVEKLNVPVVEALELGLCCRKSRSGEPLLAAMMELLN